MTKPAKTCPFCGKPRLTAGDHEETLVIAGVRFVGRVAARRCGACREAIVSAEELARFEQAAAVALIATGHRSGAVFRFARKTLGLTARALGAILGVTPETVSRWENGEREVDTSALALVAQLVRDRLGGTEDTAAMLRALRGAAPSRKGQPIRLELG